MCVVVTRLFYIIQLLLGRGNLIRSGPSLSSVSYSLVQDLSAWIDVSVWGYFKDILQTRFYIVNVFYCVHVLFRACSHRNLGETRWV